MPSILTHYYFINDCINESFPFLKNEERIALLGAQGTDPFYFYGNLLKRSDKKEINGFASLIHNSNPASLYIHFINEANKCDNEHRDFLFSYIFGLLNHYVLDRTTHPYVFYHSGIDEGFMKKHQKFETNIDVLLRLHYNEYIKPCNTIKNDIDDVSEISKIYFSYSNDTNGDLEEDTFIKAYKDMYKIQKVLYSPIGFKKWIFHTFLKNSTVDNTSMPKRITDGIDYLNLEKKLWQHPTKNFKMSLSFIELLDLAKKEFNKLGKIILKAYNKEEYEKELINFINDINHSGIKVNDKMIYSNPII